MDIFGGSIDATIVGRPYLMTMHNVAKLTLAKRATLEASVADPSVLNRENNPIIFASIVTYRVDGVKRRFLFMSLAGRKHHVLPSCQIYGIINSVLGRVNENQARTKRVGRYILDHSVIPCPVGRVRVPVPGDVDLDGAVPDYDTVGGDILYGAEIQRMTAQGLNKKLERAKEREQKRNEFKEAFLRAWRSGSPTVETSDWETLVHDLGIARARICGEAPEAEWIFGLWCMLLKHWCDDDSALTKERAFQDVWSYVNGDRREDADIILLRTLAGYLNDHTIPTLNLEIWYVSCCVCYSCEFTSWRLLQEIREQLTPPTTPTSWLDEDLKMGYFRPIVSTCMCNYTPI